MTLCSRSARRILPLFFSVLLLLPFFFVKSAAVDVRTDLLYGRSQLAAMPNSANLLWSYDAMVSGVTSGATGIVVSDKSHSLADDEWNIVYVAFLGDHGELFWGLDGISFRPSLIGGYRTFTVTPLYSRSLLGKQEEFNAAAKRLYDSAKLTSSMGEYEKALRLHDVLCQNTVYGTSDNCYNSYGAIVEGKAVCEGYSEAYQTLLRMAGIQSYVVTGNVTDGERHAWNLVRIEGKYYYIDATWDDGDVISYASFCITAATLKETRTPQEKYISLPSCTSEEANYFTVNGGRMGNPGDTEQLVQMFSCTDEIRVYITGDNWEGFFDWFSDNALNISERAGFTSVTGIAAPSVSHREYVLRINGTRGSAPSVTKAPPVTPVPTKVPTATKTPSATPSATVTKSPTATAAPTATEPPAATESPESTPTPTRSSDVSDIPPSSEIPSSSSDFGSSEVPADPSPSPAPDNSPSDTVENGTGKDPNEPIPDWIPIVGTVFVAGAVAVFVFTKKKR